MTPVQLRPLSRLDTATPPEVRKKPRSEVGKRRATTADYMPARVPRMRQTTTHGDFQIYCRL